MATLAAKDLAARLLVAQVAKLMNCAPEDVAVLDISVGKLRPLGKPNSNAVKFFSSVELMALLADREWLDEATKTIGQFWKRKKTRRQGVTVAMPTNAAPAVSHEFSRKSLVLRKVVARNVTIWERRLGSLSMGYSPHIQSGDKYLTMGINEDEVRTIGESGGLSGQGCPQQKQF